MLLPFRANVEKLCGDKFHEFTKFFLRYVASITGKNASSRPRQPNLSCIRRKLSLTDMDMNRFVALIRPEKDLVSRY